MTELVSVKEAAAILGVCEMTVRRYIKKGMLKANQYSRVIKIQKSDLENFIERTKIGGNEQ